MIVVKVRHTHGERHFHAADGAVILERLVYGRTNAALAVTFGEGAFVAQIPNDLEDRLAVSVLPTEPDESIDSVMAKLHSAGALSIWPCVSGGSIAYAESVPEWLRRPHLMH